MSKFERIKRTDLLRLLQDGLLGRINPANEDVHERWVDISEPIRELLSERAKLLERIYELEMAAIEILKLEDAVYQQPMMNGKNKRHWEYADSEVLRCGLMVFAICNSKIDAGDFKFRDAGSAFVTIHRACCQSNDLGWMRLDMKKAISRIMSKALS